jgi:8-oxo-dGTP pyrophosphatase MutT (NUDIX family)
MNHADWPALAAARWQPQPRVPLHIDGAAVGSVASAHVPALARWPRWIVQDLQGLHLAVPPAGRDEALAAMNTALRAEGLIVAWRDETFPLYAADAESVLSIFERAATRFWGTLTRGAHCNGYVLGLDGRPSHLWIARRSESKATDPGKLDNLVGGGVPHGQTPHETLVREGFEEAGLTPAQMAAAQAGRVLHLDRDVPEGRMVERVYVFDLELAPGLVPVNQDGEVASLACVPVAEAAAMAAGDGMTVDAALVTLDFLLRRGLLPAAQHALLSTRMEPLLARPTGDSDRHARGDRQIR